MKLLVLALFVPSMGFAAGVVGFWQNETFSIDAVGNKVSGYWGKKTYQVEILSNGYAGSIDGKDIRIDYWTRDVTGTLPCGELKLMAWSTEMEGIACEQSFVTTTGSQGDSNFVAKETAEALLLSEFPPPAHGTIRQHVRWFRNEDRASNKAKK